MALQTKCLIARSALLAVLACPVILAVPCRAQQAMPTLPDPGKVSISRAQQEQIGLQNAKLVYQQMPVLPDNSLETQYVRKIGSRLVGTIPQARTWPYQFHVLAEKDINAFALPGGQIFINSGTITAAQNEAQLAGVMAHEMSHVYMQHSAKQMQQAQFTQGLEGIAGSILGNMGGVLGTLGAAGVQMGANLMTLRYSRGDEAQADGVGAMIMQRTGYNPMELANFFKALEAQGGIPPQFLSDHPNPGNREEAIRSEIQGWPSENYATDNAQFAAVRNHALQVKAYSADQIAQGAKTGQWASLNKKNGAVFAPPPAMFGTDSNGASSTGSAPAAPSSAGSVPMGTGSVAAKAVSWSAVAPSSSFILTDVGLAKIVRPLNWQVMAPQQQGESVMIAPSAGVADGGVGYGVVINAMSPGGNAGNIDQITSQIAGSLESAERGLRSVGSISAISVGGARGRTVSMESVSPFADANGQSQKEKDRLVTVPRPDGSVVYFVFVAPAGDYDRLNPTFERMLQSVQF